MPKLWRIFGLDQICPVFKFTKANKNTDIARNNNPELIVVALYFEYVMFCQDMTIPPPVQSQRGLVLRMLSEKQKKELWHTLWNSQIFKIKNFADFFGILHNVSGRTLVWFSFLHRPHKHSLPLFFQRRIMSRCWFAFYLKLIFN